jgi:glycosyltransferase (activator-dependent family)
MRVLFTTYSEKTLFLPMVTLAWALRTAGHEVRVATQPALVDAVTKAGLTAVPVGRNHVMWRLMEISPGETDVARGGPLPPFDVAEFPERLSWEHLRDGYQEVVGVNRVINNRMIPNMVSFCRSWQPDLVIWEPDTYAGAVAAKASGAAHARLLWSLDFFGITRGHFVRMRDEQAAGERERDALATWLGDQAGKYGAKFSEDMATGQFTIDQLPKSLRTEADLHYVPMRYVPYNGTAVVPKWLWQQPERPRVCLTLGTTSTDRFGGYAVSVPDILDSLSDLDTEVVATLPDTERDKLERIPDNTKILSFVPLHALVPTCAAVIHHAGFGTLCTTALSAIPQLLMPDHFDEPPLARKLAEQGAGLMLDAREATGQRVREHLLRLLEEPSFSKDAALLHEEMLAMPTPNELVPQLERLTAQYKGRHS